MKQFTLLMRFIFAGDDRYYLQLKRKRERQINNPPAKREIIWTKNQLGESAYWKKKVLERN